jgi:peptide deformylase
MKLKIIQIGDPSLRQVAQKLALEEIKSSHVQLLIELMRDTMRDAPGVGLAAPQIGVPLQIIVCEDRPEYIQNLPPEQCKLRERSAVPYHVIINPSLTIEAGEKAEFFEGCLSAAGLIGLVPRALTVKVECFNELAQPVTIKAKGWYARILQHEIDHLQGILCIDHMRQRSLMMTENYIRHWKDKSVEEIVSTLQII